MYNVAHKLIKLEEKLKQRKALFYQLKQYTKSKNCN